MKRKRTREQTPDSHAFPTRPYDLLKEAVIAVVAVTLLTFGLAAVFSSPDDKPITVATWSKADPADFTATATGELGGTSTTAQYGPPYNTAADGQKLGPLSLQKWAGVKHPIDTANDFVLTPLRQTPEPPAVTTALAQWNAATADQQTKWTGAYTDALGKAPDGNPAKVAPGDYGPVPVLTARLLQLGQSGTLDAQLLAEGTYFQTDYTRALLFLADGSYLENQARAQHLGGDQWGMMNETGNYPGQAWLWLYTFWYQIDPYKSSANADALVWGTMALLSALLLFLPFIPGLRDIPRLTRVYRLIWRNWYREYPTPRAGTART